MTADLTHQGPSQNILPEETSKWPDNHEKIKRQFEKKYKSKIVVHYKVFPILRFSEDGFGCIRAVAVNILIVHN